MALVRDSAWIHMLRDGRVDEFNEKAKKTAPDLANADLRLVDLRFADLRNANLAGAYLRNADLRGVDLAEANLDGASLHDARISGTYFPSQLPADEIRMSVMQGTRMRQVGSRAA